MEISSKFTDNSSNVHQNGGKNESENHKRERLKKLNIQVKTDTGSVNVVMK